MRRRKTVTFLAALLVFGSSLADEIDHDRAQALKDSGEILPLETVLGIIRTRQPGRILDVELESEDGIYVYEVETVNDDGLVFEWYIDARTGEILKREQE